VKAIFWQCFADGLSACQAMKQNISWLQTLPNYIVKLANGALNARSWTVYRLWYKYLTDNYGTIKYPFDRLEETIPEYLKHSFYFIYLYTIHINFTLLFHGIVIPYNSNQFCFWLFLSFDAGTLIIFLSINICNCNFCLVPKDNDWWFWCRKIC